jgi:hypothetical protein
MRSAKSDELVFHEVILFKAGVLGEARADTRDLPTGGVQHFSADISIKIL